MTPDLRAILALEVPLIVTLGERSLRVSEVCALGPGSIVELPKSAEEELTLLVNNKPVGAGVAVKVGENFGVRITFIGDLKARIEALGGGDTGGFTHGHAAPGGPQRKDELAALAETMLAGR